MEKTNVTFKQLGVPAPLLDILSSKKIFQPTPIQAQALLPALNGDDCIGIAQTGTGKTLVYVLAMIQYLNKNRNKRALIVAPTRELALQIQEVCDWFKRSQRIYSTVIIGGASMKRQHEELRRNPQVIVATPGRLIDHLGQKTIRLDSTTFLVLDEADRMFDMGFAPQIKEILKSMPPKEQRQTLLFSATMPDSIARLIMAHMREPIRIEIATPGTAASEVRQEIIILDNEHKSTALLELLNQTKEAVLVFTRTKFQAKKLTEWLRKQNHRAEELHSNRSLAQRKKAVEAIQSKRSRILVATDVAARGIDIAHLRLVINYDLPENPEDYVHRIGRTGRAGTAGRAVSFVLSNQKQDLRQIQKLINTEIKQTHLETVPTAILIDSYTKTNYRSGSRQGGYRGQSSRGRSGGARRSGGGGRVRRSPGGYRGNKGTSFKSR
ncbi:MAG: DEAD/DEAH box helicase [Patescibacteria group bacterium]